MHAGDSRVRTLRPESKRCTSQSGPTTLRKQSAFNRSVFDRARQCVFSVEDENLPSRMENVKFAERSLVLPHSLVKFM